MLPSPARAVLLALIFGMLLTHARAQTPSGTWNGMLRDGTGHPISHATIQLHSTSHEYSASTSLNGEFVFTQLVAGECRLSVTSAADRLTLAAAATLHMGPT